MAKVKTVFVCNSCGAQFPKWSGQCGQCGEWQTLVEELQSSGSGVRGSGRVSTAKTSVSQGEVVMLPEVEQLQTGVSRVLTGSEEMDRVLGGGIVPGSVVLIGGEPGVGKSTLLTQLALRVGEKNDQFSNSNFQSNLNNKSSQRAGKDRLGVLYVCGEESVEQVGLRINRLQGNSQNQVLGHKQNPKTKLQSTLDRNQLLRSSRSANSRAQDDVSLGLMSEMDVDVIVETAKNKKPSIMIIDSIQTLFTRDLTGMAGSVGQVRECAYRLIELAKSSGISVFLVGHVTKEGSIAGPKVLEHMVDCVLQLSGERTGAWRILRAIKNRFGPVDEVGVFAMAEAGLVDVVNPSGAFLEESLSNQPGSVVVAVMEGTRPVLIEVQALAVKSDLAIPRRVVHGVSLAKVQVLCAVLQKVGRMPLGSYDVFVNVVGGLKIQEPAADLGIALAIASSIKNKPVGERSVLFGEVGLLGELRRVSFSQKREKEAKKLGYAEVYSAAQFSHLSVALKKLLG